MQGGNALWLFTVNSPQSGITKQAANSDICHFPDGNHELGKRRNCSDRTATASIRLKWTQLLSQTAAALNHIPPQRHRHAVHRTPAAREFVQCRVQHGHAFRAQRRVQPYRMRGRDHPVVAQRQQVTGHRHHLGIARTDHPDLALR